jgi:hypothetical protein
MKKRFLLALSLSTFLTGILPAQNTSQSSAVSAGCTPGTATANLAPGVPGTYEVTAPILLSVNSFVNPVSCYTPTDVVWIIDGASGGTTNYPTSADGNVISISNSTITKPIANAGAFNLLVIPGEPYATITLKVTVSTKGTVTTPNGPAPGVQPIGVFYIDVYRIELPTITGTASIDKYCKTPVSYTASTYGSGNQFAWTYPAGWSIAPGFTATSNPISLIPDCSTGGNVSVTVKRSQANAAYSKTTNFSVTRPNPTITRNGTWQTDNFCTSATPSFSINSICGAASYTWAMPAGWSQTNANGGLTANTTIGATATTGNITVTANFVGCGVTSVTTSAILKANALPAPFGVELGPKVNCTNNVSCYDVENIGLTVPGLGSNPGYFPQGITSLTFSLTGSSKFSSNNSQLITTTNANDAYLAIQAIVYTGTSTNANVNGGTLKVKTTNCAGTTAYSPSIGLNFHPSQNTGDPNCVCRLAAPVCTPPCPVRLANSNVTSNISAEKITIENPDEETLTIEIKDIYNNSVSCYHALDRNAEVNTDNLKAGIYYVLIKNKNEVLTVQKIVIEKK